MEPEPLPVPTRLLAGGNLCAFTVRTSQVRVSCQHAAQGCFLTVSSSASCRRPSRAFPVWSACCLGWALNGAELHQAEGAPQAQEGAGAKHRDGGPRGEGAEGPAAEPGPALWSLDGSSESHWPVCSSVKMQQEFGQLVTCLIC